MIRGLTCVKIFFGSLAIHEEGGADFVPGISQVWPLTPSEGSLIQSPLLPSRATVQIFPGKKCRLCFSPFHSGTVFTRVPLLEFHLSDGNKK